MPSMELALLTFSLIHKLKFSLTSKVMTKSLLLPLDTAKYYSLVSYLETEWS